MAEDKPSEISGRGLCALRCKLLHEYVARAKIQTRREYWIYTELFMAIHNEAGDCSHENEVKGCLSKISLQK